MQRSKDGNRGPSGWEEGMVVADTWQKSKYVLEAKLKGLADGLHMRGEEEREIKENSQDASLSN